MIIYSFICFNQSGLDLKKYIPGGVLDPAQYHHELQAPEARYKLARAVLQEIPRQVIVFCKTLSHYTSACFRKKRYYFI